MSVECAPRLRQQPLSRLRQSQVMQAFDDVLVRVFIRK